MAKYRHRPFQVDAVQWKGDNFIEVDQFITVKHEVFPKAGLVKLVTPEGEVAVKVGDWIVKGGNGIFMPCSDATFQGAFQEDQSDDESILRFYYCESLDSYMIGKRVDNFFYAQWTEGYQAFVFRWSRYLEWGKTDINGYTFPSEPREIEFNEWIKGFMQQRVRKAFEDQRAEAKNPEETQCK